MKAKDFTLFLTFVVAFVLFMYNTELNRAKERLTQLESITFSLRVTVLPCSDCHPR